MNNTSSHNLDERHENRQEGWTDVFGNQVTSRKSILDLAAHYPYSPERWRFYVDGNRQFLQYGSVPQYTHDLDSHDLTPNAGETLTFESTDDIVYSVQYELAVTFAFQLTQELQAGDRLRIGMFDDLDGWYMEQDSSHAPDEADFVIKRNGTIVSRDTENIAIPTTQFGRLKLDTGWYRTTRQKWTRSYPEEGRQQNPVIARTDALPNKGPAKGNLPLRFELTAGSGTTNLTLEAGSSAAVNSGDTDKITRAKNFRETFSIDTAGTYVPVAVFRKDPDRSVVRIEVTNTDAPKYTGTGDMVAFLIACDESKVLDANGNQLTDANFSTPNEFNDTNNVVETSTDVAQFPDSTGTIVTSAANPGGYQLGLATKYTSGAGGKITASGTGTDTKRVLANGDYAVLVVKADATGEFDYEATIEQDW